VPKGASGNSIFTKQVRVRRIRRKRSHNDFLTYESWARQNQNERRIQASPETKPVRRHEHHGWEGKIQPLSSALLHVVSRRDMNINNVLKTKQEEVQKLWFLGYKRGFPTTFAREVGSK
jgi:hypothetical protein